MRCAIFASGNGSNFQALAEAFSDDQSAIEIAFLFCDQAAGYVLERAKHLGIQSYHFTPKDFASRQAYEEALVDLCQKEAIDYIILAGYMRIIHEPLLEAYPLRIINIHPSLLPDFPGRQGIRDAYQAGVEETGVTIHYVDEGIDTGQIIAQEKLPILPGESLEELETRIHRIEHQLYPQVIKELKGR
ncbi:phosphoribosylglycinamide formyltransferase [Hutsoniella sourekii]|uniref:phosphoribosylglycinamide formyltransferase n=1 Tax=Hutsoniella sourekii TaxID=87650 RepID=UPI000480B985|nr:phosphoribosylglycinamide formyltransferase [Hutsoniella sourekii]